MTPLTNRFMVPAIAILVGTISLAVSAQAQSPAASANEPALTLARAEFRLSDGLVQTVRNRLQPGSGGSSFGRAASGFHNARVPFFNITPTAAASGPILPVLGGGTLGRLTKWTGFASNSFIGDTTIFEDKGGNVGIGTDSPTSRLSVAGQIQSLSGGIKFPDGTVQTTSATGSLFAITHDATLGGNGTSVSPLGVALPLSLTGNIFANAVISAENLNGDGVGIVGIGTRAGIDGVGAIDANGNGGAGVAGFGSDGTVNGGDGGDGVSIKAGRGFGANHRGGTAVLAIAGVGQNGAVDGAAGIFQGDVDITGTLTKGGGSFKIDHPLDPQNKYLYHSFVESPDMMNIYNGNVTTDADGSAVVTLPEWFEVLNRDFRYQLTVIGQFAQAIIAQKIKNNRFVIKTSAPNVEVSWLVTGIRQDVWANA